jgi:hypothetical protein
MKKRIEQLEAQLAANKAKETAKDKQTTAEASTKTAPAAAQTSDALTAPAATAVPVASQAATIQTATAKPVTTQDVAWTPAVRNVSTYGNSGSFWRRWVKGDKAPQSAPVTTASLATPPATAFDVRANAALNPDAPFPAGPQAPAGAPAPAAPPAAAAAPPVDNQTPFAFGDFTLDERGFPQPRFGARREVFLT